MTATDELRRLLDERGVEYVIDEEYGEKYPPEKSVTWSCDLAGEDMTVTARDYCININDDGSADYCLDLEFHEVFTPAQAITAMLGDTNATDARQDDARTCHNAAPSYLDFLCSECGFVHYHSDANDTGDKNEWCFCPNCGRRVVDA